MTYSTRFTQQVGIQYPIICGAMYPCSNPELVAAVSEAGGIGIVQPVSLVFVHRYDYRQGLQHIRKLTQKPIGVNILVEKSSKVYEQRMRDYVDISLELGVRFFVTALGNPSWVIDKVRRHGGIVYHDVTSRKWAERALQYGVDGLICVNNRAGGHAGQESPESLMNDLKGFGKPLICAGGIGGRQGFQKAMSLGYDGVQLGTRFIASRECKVHADYHNAILKAEENDIVLTDKISGVPVAVINTPYVERMGTKANWLARRLLRNKRTKHYMRMYYVLKSSWQLRHASQKGGSYLDFFQAGKSVAEIENVQSAKEIIDAMVAP